MKIKYKLLAVFFAFTFSVILSRNLHGEVIDRIVVIVNNEVITEQEVERILQPIYEQYRSTYYGDELTRQINEIRSRIIDQLIEDKILLSEAKKANIEVQEREIDAKIAEAYGHFGSKELFEVALAEQGLSLNELRKRYRDQAMVKKLIDQKIGYKISVSPTEIDEYYKSHTNEFVQPEMVKISNILIRKKESIMGSDKGLTLARDLLKRIRQGCDFVGLAKEYSEGPNAAEGGSMGYAKRGDLLPPIEAVVFDMKEEDVSDIIQTGLGYHIFKLEEKRPRRTIELSEIRPDVEEMIYREKIKEKIKDWVANLKKNAYIDFK